MSEYLYYEFQAVDRPLTDREMSTLRNYSSRATITSTRFVNSYSYGSFKGNASEWMDKYFDAFLYLANWGTHELSLRLPRRVLELETAKQYLCGECASARAKGDVVILEFRSDDEEGGSWVDDDEGSGWMSSIIPVRSDLAGGDLRALYLGWLLCVQHEEVNDDATEPPVPDGLGQLSAPLKAFADFLRIDADLIAEAAERSPEAEGHESAADLEHWIAGWPDAEKTAFLVRLAAGGEAHLRAEFLRFYRQTHPQQRERVRPWTVAELRAAAENRADERRRKETERAGRERARRKREEAEARQRYLNEIARREPETWRKVDLLIATKKPGNYDEAVKLLRDLRDLGIREGRAAEVTVRVQALREQHAKKPNFVDRLRKAGLAAPSP